MTLIHSLTIFIGIDYKIQKLQSKREKPGIIQNTWLIKIFHFGISPQKKHLLYKIYSFTFFIIKVLHPHKILAIFKIHKIILNVDPQKKNQYYLNQKHKSLIKNLYIHFFPCLIYIGPNWLRAIPSLIVDLYEFIYISQYSGFGICSTLVYSLFSISWDIFSKISSLVKHLQVILLIFFSYYLRLLRSPYYINCYWELLKDYMYICLIS